jgi:hypothetical protein
MWLELLAEAKPPMPTVNKGRRVLPKSDNGEGIQTGRVVNLAKAHATNFRGGIILKGRLPRQSWFAGSFPFGSAWNRRCDSSDALGGGKSG